MLYIRENEHTNHVKFVHVRQKDTVVLPKLKEHLEFLDEVYPEIDIEFVELEGVFSPELVRSLSKQWGVPANLMFIGAPTGQLKYRLSELGGVRLII